MQRIFLENLDENTQNLIIKDHEIVHQLTKVLRVKNGEKIILFNGKNNIDFIFEIKNIAKREIEVSKLFQEENHSEINFELTLYNALPNKLEKIEFIIQKATEIWFTKFVFFSSKRSQKLNISENKFTRLQKIIIEAAEQSGRSHIPEIVIQEESILENIPEGENIFFHTKNHNSQSIKDINITNKKNINLFVWPEWGWDETEVSLLEKSMPRVHLGNRILRTETTGISTGFYIIQSK